MQRKGNENEYLAMVIHIASEMRSKSVTTPDFLYRRDFRVIICLGRGAVGIG